MIKAVIFDMFETLVTHYRSEQYFGEDIARDLGLTEEKFRENWDLTNQDRSLGIRTFENVIGEIMEINGIYSEELLKKVSQKRLNINMEAFWQLHEEVLPMLEELKKRGIKIGLISNCFSEEVFAIRESKLYPYFDACMLSYEQGIMKPDPEIYRRCARALNVSAQECLYVGDGGSRELETATELGMKALQATWYFEDNHREKPEYKERFQQLRSPMEILNHLVLFSVKFGTQEPLQFRELDHHGIDLDLETRVMGCIGVLSYDQEKYADEEEVTRTVKENAPRIFQEGLKQWNEEKSILRSVGDDIFHEMLEKGLTELGITGKTEMVLFHLTANSQELYDAVKKELSNQGSWDSPGWDRIKELVKYVKPDCDLHGAPDPSPFDMGMMTYFNNMNVTSEKPKIKNAPTDKFCRLCGTKRESNAKFCTECGAAFCANR